MGHGGTMTSDGENIGVSDKYLEVLIQELIVCLVSCKAVEHCVIFPRHLRHYLISLRHLSLRQGLQFGSGRGSQNAMAKQNNDVSRPYRQLG